MSKLNHETYYFIGNLTYFHIYNRYHQKCVLRTGKQISVGPCDLTKCDQKWAWTPSQQIISAIGQKNPECISVNDLVKWNKLMMDSCNSNTSFQKWECKDGGDLLSCQGKELYLNYGNYGAHIVLFSGSGIWSRWIKYSTRRSICEKGWLYSWFYNIYIYERFLSS